MLTTVPWSAALVDESSSPPHAATLTDNTATPSTTNSRTGLTTRSYPSGTHFETPRLTPLPVSRVLRVIHFSHQSLSPRSRRSAPSWQSASLEASGLT